MPLIARPPTRRALLCLSASVALLAGCGSGEDQRTGGASPAHPNLSFGTHPHQAASGLHLSDADCGELARTVRAQLGRPVHATGEPSPPLSRCRLLSRGVGVSIYLDAAYAARQRYENRMVEQAQFGAPDPARVPHPVAGVGDRGRHDASWVPGMSSLFAVRGNRWLTVAYSVDVESQARRRLLAAALARRAFRLSAR